MSRVRDLPHGLAIRWCTHGMTQFPEYSMARVGERNAIARLRYIIESRFCKQRPNCHNAMQCHVAASGLCCCCLDGEWKVVVVGGVTGTNAVQVQCMEASTDAICIQ